MLKVLNKVDMRMRFLITAFNTNKGVPVEKANRDKSSIDSIYYESRKYIDECPILPKDEFKISD